MNHLEKISHETMVFMRGKYRLDERIAMPKSAIRKRVFWNVKSAASFLV